MRWEDNPAYVSRPSWSPLRGPWRLIWALAGAAILVYLVLSETYVGAGVVVCSMIIALVVERGRPHGGHAG
jgi:hypothetical protein